MSATPPAAGAKQGTQGGAGGLSGDPKRAREVSRAESLLRFGIGTPYEAGDGLPPMDCSAPAPPRDASCDTAPRLQYLRRLNVNAYVGRSERKTAEGIVVKKPSQRSMEAYRRDRPGVMPWVIQVPETLERMDVMRRFKCLPNSEISECRAYILASPRQIFDFITAQTRAKVPRAHQAVHVYGIHHRGIAPAFDIDGDLNGLTAACRRVIRAEACERQLPEVRVAIEYCARATFVVLNMPQGLPSMLPGLVTGFSVTATDASHGNKLSGHVTLRLLGEGVEFVLETWPMLRQLVHTVLQPAYRFITARREGVQMGGQVGDDTRAYLRKHCEILEFLFMETGMPVLDFTVCSVDRAWRTVGSRKWLPAPFALSPRVLVPVQLSDAGWLWEVEREPDGSLRIPPKWEVCPEANAAMDDDERWANFVEHTPTVQPRQAISVRNPNVSYLSGRGRGVVHHRGTDTYAVTVQDDDDTPVDGAALCDTVVTRDMRILRTILPKWDPDLEVFSWGYRFNCPPPARCPHVKRAHKSNRVKVYVERVAVSPWATVSRSCFNAECPPHWVFDTMVYLPGSALSDEADLTPDLDFAFDEPVDGVFDDEPPPYTPPTVLGRSIADAYGDMDVSSLDESSSDTEASGDAGEAYVSANRRALLSGVHRVGQLVDVERL